MSFHKEQTGIVVPDTMPKKLPCSYMLIGESPDWEAAQRMTPFTGKIGAELWTAFERRKIPGRPHWYITNVIPYLLPKNHKLNMEQISSEFPRVIECIERARPTLIVTAGSVATKVFLDYSMAYVHGIGHPITFAGMETTIFPIYAPGAGLHNKSFLSAFGYDCDRLRELISLATLRGETKWSRGAERSEG